MITLSLIIKRFNETGIKNKDSLSSGTHSHSMRTNVLNLISVIPVTLRDSDYSYSTYSIGSTGFCYQNVINVDNNLSAVET